MHTNGQGADKKHLEFTSIQIRATPYSHPHSEERSSVVECPSQRQWCLAAAVECRGTSKTKYHLNTVRHLLVAEDQRLTLHVD